MSRATDGTSPVLQQQNKPTTISYILLISGACALPPRHPEHASCCAILLMRNHQRGFRLPRWLCFTGPRVPIAKFRERDNLNDPRSRVRADLLHARVLPSRFPVQYPPSRSRLSPHLQSSPSWQGHPELQDAAVLKRVRFIVDG